MHDGAHGPGLGGGRWEPGPGPPIHWGWGEDQRGIRDWGNFLQQHRLILPGVGAQLGGRVQGDLQDCGRLQLCCHGHRVSRGGGKTHRRVQVNIRLSVPGRLLPKISSEIMSTFAAAEVQCWPTENHPAWAHLLQQGRRHSWGGLHLAGKSLSSQGFSYWLQSLFSLTSSSTCQRTCMQRIVLNFCRFWGKLNL